MARPKKPRRICGLPDYCAFRAEKGGSSDTVEIGFDEFEALRFVDYLGLSQEEAAARMQVSRPTITQICEKARRKIMEALVHGKKLAITGGNYHVCSSPECDCPKCISAGCIFNHTFKKEEKIMRIAIPFDHGTICQHFGRAPQFKFFDIEDGKVKSVLTVDTLGSGHGAIAGFLQANEADAVICGGIGGGAQMALATLGIELIPGVAGDPGEAIEKFIAGTLIPGGAGQGCGCGCGAHEHKEAEGGCCGGHGHEEGHECGCGGHGHEEAHECGCGGHGHEEAHECGCGSHGHEEAQGCGCGCGGKPN